ncbi:substrate-binding domain-containing protein [Inquilinus sp. NPDC058860]|uniref:substrate-binding domain-containing protein n=1 Tax=Inquilinus sp. NPDC058860 TaxID=3346652 RepID=UPI00367BA780
MSIRLKSCSLLALVAGGMFLAAAPASAETIYSGGATLPFQLYRQWFDCFYAPLVGPRPATCTAAKGYPADGADVIAYAPVGSGAGVNALIGQTSVTATPSSTPYETASIPYAEGTTGYGTGPNFWDFSGSDGTLTAANLGTGTGGYANTTTGALAARGPAIQVPSVGTPVTIPVNTTGLTISRADPAGGASGVYLSRKAYCGIFTGTITNWNDPVLTQDNNGVQYHANRPITVVRRSDSSGTTFLLSRHLEQVCNGGFDGASSNNNHTGTAAGNLADWTGGAATTVTWPTTGTFVSAAGSEGVARVVSQTVGAIGYVSPDFTLMIANPVPLEDPVTHAAVANPQVAVLQNQARFASATHTGAQPSITNTRAGIVSFTAPPATVAGQTASAWSTALDSAALRNPTGTSAYPMVGFTMLDFYTCYFPANETAVIKEFVSWITGHHATITRAEADELAEDNGFVALTQTQSDAVWNWINNASRGMRTGPISGTCTIASGT